MIDLLSKLNKCGYKREWKGNSVAAKYMGEVHQTVRFQRADQRVAPKI
jgi:hypothetical protein